MSIEKKNHHWAVLVPVFVFLVNGGGILVNGNAVGKDFFSSVSGMEELYITEMFLLHQLEEYIYSLSNHINTLQSEIELIRSEHDIARQDLEGYLNNPVNAYRLIKRLHTDWPTFEDHIHSDMTRSNLLLALDEQRQNSSFPTDEDVMGSAMAMVRLQDTYQLDVAEVASGILNGVKYGTSMSWQDCFLLGHNLYTMRDYNHTVPWLKQSMKMLLAADTVTEDDATLDFIETVAMYHQEMGDFMAALTLINHILSIDNERQGVQETKVYLEQMITDGVRKGLLHEASTLTGDYHQTEEYKLYERVCRSELSPTPSQQRSLHCKHHTNGVAYRLLQPFKLEILSEDPYVVQLHGVINTQQVEAIKRLAKPKIKRSEVFTDDGSESIPASYRISKTAWFQYYIHDDMEKMRQNLADFSGLNVEAVEELQVVNYGIGGYYEPHFDFFVEDRSFSEREGNRIATCIYYLSDVEEGGGTAFPFLPLLVRPQQGSALFWYNLHRSEDSDYRTKHAACPVLKGTKWIANIWTRVRKQEFARPCLLERDHEISLCYKD